MRNHLPNISCLVLKIWIKGKVPETCASLHTTIWFIYSIKVSILIILDFFCRSVEHLKLELYAQCIFIQQKPKQHFLFGTYAELTAPPKIMNTLLEVWIFSRLYLQSFLLILSCKNWRPIWPFGKQVLLINYSIRQIKMCKYMKPGLCFQTYLRMSESSTFILNKMSSFLV